MAQHYGIAIVPARPGKPKDKAKVEVGRAGRAALDPGVPAQPSLLQPRGAQRGDQGAAREAQHKAVQEARGVPAVGLREPRPPGDAAAARRVVTRSARWKLGVGVNIDYHFEYDHRYYSVPCELMNEKVDVRATAHGDRGMARRARVTSHERSYGPKGTAMTKPEHRPRAHRELGEWPPERLVALGAARRGRRRRRWSEAILSRGAAPGVGSAGVPGAAADGRAVRDRAAGGGVRARAADRQPDVQEREGDAEERTRQDAVPSETNTKAVVHENIRGGEYFDRGRMERGELEENRSALFGRGAIGDQE